MQVIRIGTRPSPLAKKQAEEIAKRIPQFRVNITAIDTKGDLDKQTPLFGREDSDLFTREIEEALLKGDIDAAVHSAKDLESNIPSGLVIAAMTRSISPLECLVSRGNLSLNELPPGARVGTSSLKRKESLLRFRNDLVVEGIRGNIDERLAQLDSARYDAIIIAHAALIRLGYEQRIAQIIPREIIEPHPLQGRLCVQIRRDRCDLSDIFGSLNEK
ncbi:MAG: hydroxymethylbilane synthase [Candidatus Omnitrophica bacterium]|nr:hydroxymethylbilane synthase [Candidatus Omnitrophota bacterium]